MDLENKESSSEMYLHDKEQCAKWVVNLAFLTKPTNSYKIKELSNI